MAALRSPVADAAATSKSKKKKKAKLKKAKAAAITSHAVAADDLSEHAPSEAEAGAEQPEAATPHSPGGQVDVSALASPQSGVKSHLASSFERLDRRMWSCEKRSLISPSIRWACLQGALVLSDLEPSPEPASKPCKGRLTSAWSPHTLRIRST